MRYPHLEVLVGLDAKSGTSVAPPKIEVTADSFDEPVSVDENGCSLFDEVSVEDNGCSSSAVTVDSGKQFILSECDSKVPSKSKLERWPALVATFSVTTPEVTADSFDEPVSVDSGKQFFLSECDSKVPYLVHPELSKS